MVAAEEPGAYVLAEDLKHSQINVYFDPRRPPTPHEFVESSGTEVNVLKKELVPLQPSSP